MPVVLAIALLVAGTATTSAQVWSTISYPGSIETQTYGHFRQ
jgi:hypothetical protein